MTPSSFSSMIRKSSSPSPLVLPRSAGGLLIARDGDEDGGVLRLKKVCRETLDGGLAPTTEEVLGSLFLTVPCFRGHRITPFESCRPDEMEKL
jgi:hypothetical protein